MDGDTRRAAAPGRDFRLVFVPDAEPGILHGPAISARGVFHARVV
ncbi:hypothetical protein SBF1_2560002 [Candidatus Desulfosporosinus infrequens]|uniref:Uncharacterized protein n=1 Tax=Candidatus Desulfosporosinus infrequens TaxID=2043169 RepID=A0A2U3KPZ1_9FIRM|nr:hypothetical protein SBF1_2560002 [Candidatus Desulfosporosinus infrequens]